MKEEMARAEEMEEADSDEDEDEDPHAPPALLITTSLPSNSTSPHLSSANARSHSAERVRQFVDELLNIFPGAEYRPRAKAKGVGLGKIAGWARTRGYGAMLIVGEDKEPEDRVRIYLALWRLTPAKEVDLIMSLNEPILSTSSPDPSEQAKATFLKAARTLHINDWGLFAA